MKINTILEAVEEHPDGFRVYVSPTKRMLLRLIEKSEYGEVRGSFTNYASFFWDAADAVHGDATEGIGVNSDDVHTDVLVSNKPPLPGNYGASEWIHEMKPSKDGSMYLGIMSNLDDPFSDPRFYRLFM